VTLKEPEVGSTDPNIPIDNTWTNDELHVRMPGVSRDFEEECDEIDQSDAMLTACW